jgi:hypothetical protein
LVSAAGSGGGGDCGDWGPFSVNFANPEVEGGTVLPEVTVDEEVTPADPRNAAFETGGVSVPLDFTAAAGKPLKKIVSQDLH